VSSVRIYTPRSRQVRNTLIALGFALAGGLVLAGNPTGRMLVYAYVGVIFFGFGALLFLVQLLRHQPALEIDADGINDRSSLMSVGRLRWSDIDAVWLTTLKIPTPHGRTLTKRMLSVSPRDWNVVVARANPVKRFLIRLNSRSGYQPMNISEQALPYSLETLVDEMRRLNPRLVVETGRRQHSA
jgi:hypothetical protein